MNGKQYIKKFKNKKYKYIITIDDGYCKWKTDLIANNGKQCIAEIIDAICLKFKMEEVKSKYIGKGYKGEKI